MSDVTNKKLNIYIDQSSAQFALETLQKKADGLTKSIEQGTASGKKMKDAINQLGETNIEIKKVQEQLDKGLAPSIRQQTTYVEKLRNELRKMSASAPEFDKLSAKFKEQSALLKKMQDDTLGVQRAQKAITNESSMFGKLGIAGGVAMGNLYTKAAEVAIDTVKRFVTVNAEFEKSIANLSAITGAAGKDLEYLKNAAINMSETSTRSAKDYVEAMKFIASAKPELLSNKEALVEVTKAASLLADASGLELPDASKRLTDALNQFGTPASQAAKYVDALAAAAKYGAAEVPEVTDALLQFGSQAKSANINIYESSAAIEVLAEKGIKGAEAGTKLRNVFLALNAVNALDKKALQSLQDAGVNTTILSDKTLSLEARLKELSKVQGDASALVNIFGKENFNAGQIILQNIPRYAQLVKQTKETGVAHQQATVNTDTLSAAWDRLGNQANAEFLREGGAFTGFLKSIVNFGSKAFSTLSSVIIIAKSLATFDFGIFGRINKEVAKNKEAATTNTKVNTIIDVYTQQEQGKADATERILKRLRENVDREYKDFYDARAKGDKDAAGKAYNNLQLAGKALAKYKADQATITPTAADGNNDNKGGKTESSLDKQQESKAKALREKYLDFLGKLNGDIAKATLDPLDVAFNKIDEKLRNGIELLEKARAAGAITKKEFEDALAKTQSAALAETEKATRDFIDKRRKDRGEAVTVSVQPNLEIKNPDKLVADGISLIQKILNREATNKTAGLQLDVLKFGLNNRKGLNSQKELLKEQEEKAIKEAELAGKTENEIALIKETYRQQDAQLDADYFNARLQAISGFAQQAMGIINTIAQAQNARENAQLANEIKANDKRRKQIQDLQKNKVITEIEARKRIAELDASDQKKKDELEKKQFERNKKIALSTALVNGALAITSVLAAKPGVTDILSLATFRAINIALTVATTAAQIATIAGSKYAKGGRLTGPSHSAGGMPVINPTTGAKEAEVEGGEYILSKATVANNRTLADMLLHSSMNNNGAPITLPQWQSRQYRPIDFSGISQSATKLRFANGGVMPGAATNSEPQVVIQNDPELKAMLIAIMETNIKLQQQLQKPIAASVSLKKIDDAYTLEANILSEATP